MAYRYYQHEATEAVFDFWSGTAGHPLVDMATGTGKSKTMSKLTREMVTSYPDMRVLNCTHVVELVESNFLDLMHEWPFAPAGLYAAALGRRDRSAQILFGQLQTIWNRAEEIGLVDVMLIDEVHLVPANSNTMYRKLIDALLAINPDMKICGFTATPYRLDSGRLDEGDDKLFDQVVYTYGIRQGIDDGYLCPVTSKPTDNRLDITGVGKSMGEYKKGELQRAVDKSELNQLIVEEVLDVEGARECALFFCAGIEHATHMRDEIRAAGRTCEVLSGKTPKGERRAMIEALKRGDIWAITNDNVMSTGTNVPRVDLIVDLAPTASASRYVQRVGRSTRVIYPVGFNPEATDADGRRGAIANGPKPNARYMNFAMNVERHGPVDAIEPKKPGKGEGDAPIKLCPQCEEILHASIRVCWCCGHEFVFDTTPKIQTRASDAPILSTAEPIWREVTGRTFREHAGKSGPCVRIDYQLGLSVQKDFVGPESVGFFKQKSDRLWRSHGGKLPFPSTVAEFLDRADELAVTTDVEIRKNGKYWNVVNWKVGAHGQPSEVVRPEAANDNERERLAKLAVGEDLIPF